MEQDKAKMSGKSPKAEVFEMSAAAEARQLIVAIAGPSPSLGASVKEALARVARKTGLPHRRIRGIYNSEARAIRAEELDALRRVARPKANTDEFELFAARLALVEARLTAIDPDFHSADIDALRNLNDRVRRVAARGE